MIVTATVSVELPDTLDEDPCTVLLSVLGGALEASDLRALRLQAVLGDKSEHQLDLAWIEETLVPKAVKRLLRPDWAGHEKANYNEGAT